MTPEETAAQRRFLAVLLAPVFALITSVTHIQISETIEGMIIGLIMLYVGGSHVKAVQLEKAKTAGQKAADEVKSLDDAAKVLAPAPAPEAKP